MELGNSSLLFLKKYVKISSMLNKKKKETIIRKYRIHKTDTGSANAQIAILTKEIKELTQHLKTHKKDNASRRGLLKKVAKRKKLLSFLQRKDGKKYDAFRKELKL